jgi:hypothetical protein
MFEVVTVEKDVRRFHKSLGNVNNLGAKCGGARRRRWWSVLSNVESKEQVAERKIQRCGDFDLGL